MKKKDFIDDGRRIADMSVIEDKGLTGSLKRHKAMMSNDQQREAGNDQPPASREEIRSLMLSSVISALVIAGIFLVAVALFILFCINVWFK